MCTQTILRLVCIKRQIYYYSIIMEIQSQSQSLVTMVSIHDDRNRSKLTAKQSSPYSVARTLLSLQVQRIRQQIYQ